MLQLLAIAVGGALGAVMRYLISRAIHFGLGQAFPYGILLVNVLGSLLIGLLFVLLIERFDVTALWRAAVFIGFLGGFTTFSSFSLDSVTLIEQGSYILAGIYVLLSVSLCITGTVLGMLIGRNL